MWQKIDNSLYRKFEFKDFDEAIVFIEKVAGQARELNHHPKIVNNYDVVELWLSTHSQGGKITEKDELLASQIDQIMNDKSTQPKNDLVQEKVKLYTDGGSRGNPGPSAIGYVIFDPNDQIIEKNSKYLGIKTNNQAEYTALIEGLEHCKSISSTEVDVYMDSLLIVNQINGSYRVKSGELIPLHATVIRLIEDFKKVTFTHVRRELNSIADAMVNQCLDSNK